MRLDKPDSESRVEITKRKLIISEGVDDKHFFDVLFKHLELTNIQSEQIEGKTKLKSNLKALILQTGFSSLDSFVITRDADEDHKAAFQSVCGALKDCGLDIPPKPGVFTSGKIRIGIFIFPGSGKDGCLEDLCIEAVNQKPEFSCVESYFQCLQDLGIKTKHLSKAKSRVFVASIDGEITHLGRACERKCWSLDAPAFIPLIKFLKQM